MSDFIVNGTLIDGTDASPVPLRWIEIVDGRIADMVSGPANAGRPLPADANILFDARDRTVMPGIVDSALPHQLWRGPRHGGAGSLRLGRIPRHPRHVARGPDLAVGRDVDLRSRRELERGDRGARRYQGRHVRGATHRRGGSLPYEPYRTGRLLSDLGRRAEIRCRRADQRRAVDADRGPRPGQEWRGSGEDRGQRRILDPVARRRQRSGVPARGAGGDRRRGPSPRQARDRPCPQRPGDRRLPRCRRRLAAAR